MNRRSIFLFCLVNVFMFFYAHSSQPLTNDPIISSTHSYRVLGIGASCIDLLLPVEEPFLEHVSGRKGGCCLIEQEELNQLIQMGGNVPKIVTGGSSANTIKGLASLGESCGFLSRIGQDHLGEYFAHYMKTLGVVGLFSRSSQPTTQTLCLITPDGARTMRTAIGCTQETNESFLFSDDFKGVKLVHLDAYTLRLM